MTPSHPPEDTQTQFLGQNDQCNVNLEHISLLYHFHAEIAKDLQSPDLPLASFDLIRGYITSAPYLTYQILAVSALHLSFEESDRRDYYRKYATRLQNQALAIFNRCVNKIEDTNCVPALVFSSMIGLHVLCEAIRYYSDDLETFLSSFAHFLALHSGVRVIAHAAWDVLKQAEHLKPYLQVPEKATEVVDSPGSECAGLNVMLEQADLGAKSLEIYISTVKHLQWAFDVSRCARNASESRQMLLAWTTLVPSGYIDLLVQQRPEALVILAHYGVLLLRNQDFWVVKGGGSFLVRVIREKLSQYWEAWLAWPLAELHRIENSGNKANFHDI